MLMFSYFLFIQWPLDVRKLSCLDKSAIKKGKTDIYPAWKSLLNQWLSKANCKVYLVTPFLDEKRLIDICNIVIDNTNTANIEAFFVRELCFDKNTYKDIEKAAIKEIKDERKGDYGSLIETKISKKIVHPKLPKNFHAKLIGCIYNDEDKARVLVTSANFAYQSFHYDNLESVVCHEMTKDDFTGRFITPLRSVCQ